MATSTPAVGYDWDAEFARVYALPNPKFVPEVSAENEEGTFRSESRKLMIRWLVCVQRWEAESRIKTVVQGDAQWKANVIKEAMVEAERMRAA